MPGLSIEPNGERDHGPCECCGDTTRSVMGLVRRNRSAHAAYSVTWAVGRVRDHDAIFDVIIGKWGDRAKAADRSLVSLLYRVTDDGPMFMVVDSAGRPYADVNFVANILTREQVIGKPIAKQVFDVVDAILEQDDRIVELVG